MNDFLSEGFWQTFYNNAANWTINQLPSIIILVLLFIIALRLLRMLVSRTKKIILNRAVKGGTTDELEAAKRINTLAGILSGIGLIILWSLFLMILLKKIGIDIGPILAGAGILGLAVGFGAQELVKDFISGFFILLENQIRTGDVAVINDTAGLVEKIELRTITLRDFAGTVHIFQNGKINSLSNMTKEWSAIVFDIGVAYKEDPESVMKIMAEIGSGLSSDPDFSDKILQPIEIFGVDQFADSAVVIKARIKTIPSQQWFVGREYRKRLKIAFDREGIEIPFPHTTVYWGEKINPLSLEVKKES